MDRAGTAVRSVVDARHGDEIGRRARLELHFRRRGQRTALDHAYAEPPYRIGRALPDGDGAHFILASSAPGLFGGDRFAQSIVVDAGARVRLTSQSALQVHPSASGATGELHARYTVGDGGRLVCEWDPIIPFPSARFQQQLEVTIEGDGQLHWSDAMMSGREARGERWCFDRFAHELSLRRRGALVYLERYALEPATVGITPPWVAGAAVYFGTVLSVGRGVGETEALQQALSAMAGVDAAVDRLEPDVRLVRLASASGPLFHAARRLCAPGGD